MQYLMQYTVHNILSRVVLTQNAEQDDEATLLVRNVKILK